MRIRIGISKSINDIFRPDIKKCDIICWSKATNDLHTVRFLSKAHPDKYFLGNVEDDVQCYRNDKICGNANSFPFKKIKQKAVYTNTLFFSHYDKYMEEFWRVFRHLSSPATNSPTLQMPLNMSDIHFFIDNSLDDYRIRGSVMTLAYNTRSNIIYINSNDTSYVFNDKGDCMLSKNIHKMEIVKIIQEVNNE